MTTLSGWLAASTRRRMLVGVCVMVAVVGAELGVVAAVRAARPDDSQPAAVADPESEDVPPGISQNRVISSSAILYGPPSPCFFPGPYGVGTEVIVGCEPFEELFRRDANGVTIRVYESPEQAQASESFCGPEGACPPPECFPSRYVSAGLSNEAAVGYAYGPMYATPFEPLVGASGLFGVAEGDPVVWAVVQVGPEVETVRAEFAAGDEDEMEPVDGVVVLAGPADEVEGDPPGLDGTVEALDAAGDVVASTDLRGLPGEDRVLGRPECAPRPPPLPEPDGPPPADEEAARQAVIAVFTEVFSGNDRGGQNNEFVDDPTGIAEAVEVVRQRFPGAISDTNSVRVDEVRFLNPTTAAVRYAIVLPDYSVPEFPNRIGRAVLVDGTWKVTRDTICHDLELGGATCSP